MKKVISIIIAVGLITVLCSCATTSAPSASTLVRMQTTSISGNSQNSSTLPAADNSGTSTETIQSGLPLNVTEPANESIIDVSTVTIRGQTLAYAVVSVNGDLVDVDSNGNFSVPVTLDEGPNVFDIIATDEAGNEADVQLVVSYAP